MKKILISTVTPVYCGEHFLKDLVCELEKVKNKWEAEDYPFVLAESIFVDDGSIDNSSTVLAELEQEYPWVNVLCLSKNFGQHPATEAGMLHTSGDWVITLDEDLQHHPEQFVLLLKTALESNSDIVYASPKKSVHGSFYRDISSRLAKWFVGLITGNPFVKDFNSFRLVRGSIARGVGVICGYNLYLDIALCWFTKRISSITLDIEDKRYQENKSSGYSFMKLVRHCRRLFISSQIRIFRLGALVGILSMFLAILGGVFVIFQRIFQPEKILLQGWTSIMVLILFLGGIILFFLSLIIEYIGVVLLQVQGQPTFFLINRSQDRIVLEKLLEKDDFI